MHTCARSIAAVVARKRPPVLTVIKGRLPHGELALRRGALRRQQQHGRGEEQRARRRHGGLLSVNARQAAVAVYLSPGSAWARP